MTGSLTLQSAKLKLFNAVRTYSPPALYPLLVSPYVAMSILQKAIRRGEECPAWRAAARLLQIAPEKLWRRLGCIAFEDIGVADVEAIAITMAGLSGKRFRETIGGEWHVASYLVSRQARAVKCRAADDLLMMSETHPALANARAELARRSIDDLLTIAAGSHPLPIRALAAWFALGTNRWTSRHLPVRSGNPPLVFEVLEQAGASQPTVEIAREGWKKLSEVLCPFLALLAPLLGNEPMPVSSDDFPAEEYIGGVPSWSLDLYSREGRAALAAFLASEAETARWVRLHVPQRLRVQFIGGLVFRMEGGLLRSRLRWAIANELRDIFDIECLGAGCRDARELLGLMRRDIPQLNLVRTQTIRLLIDPDVH
jgi:hypothetical protein